MGFLGVFAKLQKAIISFVVSVCPSAWNNSVPIRLIFHKILCFSIIRKYFEKIQVLLKSDKNNERITRRPIYNFYHISFSSS
jgi:hypothetical protein